MCAEEKSSQTVPGYPDLRWLLTKDNNKVQARCSCWSVKFGKKEFKSEIAPLRVTDQDEQSQKDKSSPDVRSCQHRARTSENNGYLLRRSMS